MIKHVRHYFRFSYKTRKLKYFNVPCAFDVEASSWINEIGEKCATMYMWSFGLFGAVMIGRTWDEWEHVVNALRKVLDLNENKRLIIYVHNLAYDFQWIRKHHEWDKVFALEERVPVYALTNGIEYRCSYILSGYSLETIGENLHRYHVTKKTGDLDHRKVRHSATPIEHGELVYSCDDVRVLMAYIMECIERDGGISKILLTKTSYVRQRCKEACLSELNSRRLEYKLLMKSLTIEPWEYEMLKDAFQGGYVHANGMYANQVLDDVASDDETSAYPYAMVSEQYPMTKGELVTVKSEKQFKELCRDYCCLIEITFHNIYPTFHNDFYISSSRCSVLIGADIINGRVIQAEELTTTITEQDFAIIDQTYDFDSYEVHRLVRYKKAYLPTPLVKTVLEFYAKKTELKGVKGKEREYVNNKENCNACYGMTVTDPLRDEIIYTDDWHSKTPELVEAIAKYNDNYNRFLFYPWGVWVTAYARRNLWTAILELDDDYCYSDTDSVKHLNHELHIDYFNRYNNLCLEALKAAAEYHNIDYAMCTPKTIKGITKPLGVWDFEGTYTRFKTLGAKRYMIEDGEGVSITVSGLAKSKAVPYICRNWYYDLDGVEHNSPFERFDENLTVAKGYTGRLIHTYIDEETEGTVTDYRGVTSKYYELSSIHMDDSEYNLSCEKYLEAIIKLKEMDYE